MVASELLDAHGLAVCRNQKALFKTLPDGKVAERRPAQYAVVDRLHVARNQHRIRSGIVHGDRIFQAHDDRVIAHEHRVADVEYDDVRLVLFDSRLNVLVPDGVTWLS